MDLRNHDGDAWDWQRWLQNDWTTRKTVRFPKQVMSADKHPSIYLRQMEAIVYLNLCDAEDNVD